MEWLLILIDMKNFVLCCYPSLKVQEVNISREGGEKQWVTAWSTKFEGGGIGPLKLACKVLVMMAVLFVENLATA